MTEAQNQPSLAAEIARETMQNLFIAAAYPLLGLVALKKPSENKNWDGVLAVGADFIDVVTDLEMLNPDLRPALPIAKTALGVVSFVARETRSVRNAVAKHKTKSA